MRTSQSDGLIIPSHTHHLSVYDLVSDARGHPVQPDEDGGRGQGDVQIRS